MDQVYEQPDSLHTGLETAPEFDPPRPAMRVTRIRWYSGFRNSGLEVGDRVVAVAGRPIALPADAREASVRRPQQIGQYAEAAWWKEAGAKDGDEVALTVQRRVVPGRGVTELTVRGAIRNERGYRNADNRPLFGPGGPDHMARDDYASAWLAWHDEFGALIAAALDDAETGPLPSSAYGLDKLREHEPRVRALGERFPGPYASAIAADFERARGALEGRAYTLSDEDLAWRRANERRIEEVAAAGRAAREAFAAARAAELVPPFPSVDPILGDRSKFAGKLVELPEIGNREWISQGARSCLVWNRGDDWYTVDAEGDAFQKALFARARYQRTVTEAIGATYAVIGRVRTEPTQVVVADRGYFAFAVEPIAVTLGGGVFVDVSLERGPQPAFAGEARAGDPLRPPPDDAAPERVLDVFFAALKVADQALWRSLFAAFDVWFTDGRKPIVSPLYLGHEESTWGQARRAILEQIYDVRVVWCAEPRALVTGDEFPGAPRIDEVAVEVEHVGRRDDGTYHAIRQSGLRRYWLLRRRDGGPWRIATQSGM